MAVLVFTLRLGEILSMQLIVTLQVRELLCIHTQKGLMIRFFQIPVQKVVFTCLLEVMPVNI